MAYWLAKTEPETYNYADLERLGRDTWNGVKNFAALKHLRAMHPGDLVYIYHTGKEKAIVGVAEVVSEPYPDPAQQDDRFVVTDFVPRYRLPRSITLKEIKENPFFGNWALVRQSRLSVMPVAPEYWHSIQQMATP